jgi:16S rRNA (cytosine1402-N4)-methyltransferase
MSDSEQSKPPRRLRYRGTHPRHFAEKYKELDPSLHADEIAKIVGRGQTPAGTHRPVLLDEVMRVLAPRPGDIAIDCTLGYGGHASRLLAAIQPGGKLLAIDVDPIELPKAQARLIAEGYPRESLIVRRTNFAGLAQFVAEESPAGVDRLLADLGCSSMQLDDPSRGFTFRDDGPLDMRMNPNKGVSAAELLATLDVNEFARLLAEYADEPDSDRLARGILAAQANESLVTTRSLADAVRAAAKSAGCDRATVENRVRGVFQALRIAVNDELATLEALLRGLPDCLKPGGRAAIISFHSGEDRRVKSSFKEGRRSGVYSAISEEVIRAGPDERRDNPRSRSAKLRFAIRSNS